LPRFARLSWPTFAVAFAAGVFCCGVGLRLAPQLTGGNDGFSTASNGSGMAMWIKAAAGYQQLYSRDTIVLLQPDSRVTAATVAEIHDVDNLAMQIPDLRSQGLTFKRVQRLRFHDKPLVQIVYLPEKGKPVALCVLKEAKADAAPSSDRVDGMAVVAWRRGQLGYALIGEPGTVDLDALGKQLYDGQVSTTISDAGNAHRV
jgi:anti-sigma factor RsiW